MSRIRIFLLAALFLCVFSRPLFSATNEFLTVQVKQGQLRSTPSFLGSITATLAYGDKVELIEDKGSWKMVAIRKIKGWMHMSALTTKTIALQAGKADVKTGELPIYEQRLPIRLKPSQCGGLRMSRIRISLLAALFLCVFSRPLFSATNEFLTVQVKQGQLRSTPSFLGSVTATLAYGDKVELI